jgi:hypothetical protein
MVERACRARAGKPMFMADLAVPRDIAPKASYAKVVSRWHAAKKPPRLRAAGKLGPVCGLPDGPLSAAASSRRNAPAGRAPGAANLPQRNPPA